VGALTARRARGEGRRSGSNRGIRGGSWNNDASNLAASNRNNNDPTNENDNIGFRVASPRGAAHGAREAPAAHDLTI
jgi:formylglycine-generating enzyme required for sulfatase activity